jgi:23S rRNA pseudouridine1911/1915/1917 synthase
MTKVNKTLTPGVNAEDFDLVNQNEKSAENDSDDKLYEHFRIEVDKGQSLLRIDKFLMLRIENATRSKIQNAADVGSILVNNKPVKSSYRVKPFDVISIVLTHPVRVTELLPENIPLNIVYEDDDVVLVNKVAGMVVHPGYSNYTGTLVNAIIFHFQNLPTHRNGEMRPGLVHRIDKNTSGLLVIAKNDLAMTALAKEFFDHTIERTYWALVWGDLKQDSGTITGHIGHSLRDRKIMDVFPSGEYGKHAVTHYKVLERFGYVTLVQCNLETGRTHQIRAHFKHIGHPLFNDESYGGDKILKGTTFTKYKQFVENCFSLIPRQALHAKTLGFTHPTTKKEVFFDTEIPADFKAALDKWRNYGRYVGIEN